MQLTTGNSIVQQSLYANSARRITVLNIQLCASSVGFRIFFDGAIFSSWDIIPKETKKEGDTLDGSLIGILLEWEGGNEQIELCLNGSMRMEAGDDKDK